MASEQELAERRRKWQDLHGQTIDLDEYEDDLVEIIEQIAAAEHLTPGDITRLLYRVSKGDGPVGKDQVVQAYRELAARGVVKPSRETLAKLRTKPVRTISGVAPVTVLTKPFPCPGECIFCPEFSSMPKSYIPTNLGRFERHSSNSTVPADGAPHPRAGKHRPQHRQDRVAHPGRDVVVLSARLPGVVHPPLPGCDERRRVCNARRSTAEKRTAPHRNVGLVIETRPDYVDEARSHACGDSA